MLADILAWWWEASAAMGKTERPKVVGLANISVSNGIHYFFFFK